MTLKTLCCYLFVPGIISCKGGGANQPHSPAPKADSTTALPRAAVTACDTTTITDSVYTIRNDQVIKETLETVLSCTSLDSIYRDVKKETKTSPNKYENKSFDTTVLYRIDCDSIIYLSSGANCFPLHLNIQSQRLSFDKGSIKVGMTKGKFKEKYGGKKDIPDIIRIAELEGSNELILFFSQGLLTKVIYNNLYVD
jgi:hypothetical protein